MKLVIKAALPDVAPDGVLHWHLDAGQLDAGTGDPSGQDCVDALQYLCAASVQLYIEAQRATSANPRRRASMLPELHERVRLMGRVLNAALGANRGSPPIAAVQEPA